MSKPLGKAIRWSKPQIKALATVQPETLLKAARYWKQAAPEKYARLLEAKKQDG